MSGINLDRVRNVFKDSEKADESIQRSTSDQALLRARRMASDQAKATFVSDESMYGTEATIDPYDTTTKAAKTSKKDLLTLSGSNYRTSLLEQLVKNQNNKEFNTSVLTFQDKTLTYLDSIEKILKSQFAPNKDRDSMYNTNKELGREMSDLAKAMAEFNPENMAIAMRKGVTSQFGLDSLFSMGDLALSTLKDTIKDGNLGVMIKDAIQEQMINALPKNARDKVNRFKDDPVNFFQDIINTVALDRNATIAQIFRPHARGFKPSEQREKFDAHALAKFDNKFYTSVTKIMPDQLLKMNTYLEKLATGRVSDIQTFDWKKGDYTSLLKDVKGFLDTATTNQKATDEIYKDLTDQLQDIIEKGTDKSGLLARKTKRDEYGIFDYDDDGTIKFSDKEDFKRLVSEIINSKGGFNELRGNSVNIEQYLKDNELGYKIVNGRYVKKSDQELSVMRNNLLTLRSILTSMDPTKATKLEESLMGFKRDLSTQSTMDTRGWNQDIIRSMVDVANSAASPETLRSLFGSNGYFGGGGPTGPGPLGGGPTQPQNAQPQLYKNRRGQMVTWENLTDSERAGVTNSYIKNNKFGDRLSNDIIFRHTSNLQTTETEESKCIRNAYEHGVLSTAEYEDYINGVRPYDTYKEKLDNYDAAIGIFNDLDAIGLTASQMRTLNPNMSLRDYENLGYMSSPEQLSRYIKNGKLDIATLSRMNSMYSQSFSDNLSRVARDRQRGATFDEYDPAGSMSNIFNSIFGDPRISKKAGIAAGTAAGLGINKLLKMSGIMDSPKLGIILGGVGAALMMTERAQNMVKDIFGPEGDVRGESGYTNKEIFMSRLMTRWLPSVGAGTKVASATAKFFSKGGPVMAMMGIPAALVTGLTASWVAPRLVELAQDRLFSKEAREKGGFLGKAGEFIRNLNIPFVNKYIIGDKAESSEIDIHINALSTELNRSAREMVSLENKLREMSPDDPDRPESEDRFNTVKRDFKLYEKAISDLKSLKSRPYDDVTKAKVADIFHSLSEGESKLSVDAQSKLRTSQEQARANAEFSAGGAARSRFSSSRDRANSAYTRFISEGGDPDSETGRRLARLGETGSLSATFNDFGRANAEGDIAQYGIINRLKNTNDFNHVEIETLIRNMAGQTKERKIEMLNEYVDNNPNVASAPLIRDYIMSKINQDDEKTRLFDTVFAVQKALHPEMSDHDLQLITNSEVAQILNSGRVRAGADYAAANNVQIVWDEVRSRFNDFVRTEGDRISDQGISSMNDLYNEIINTDIPPAGSGTEGDSKIFKMSELKDFRFKNGSSLSASGCSVVAFNNALYYLGIPQVEINTLVSVANKYLTSDGGVTSEFFLEMCQRLNITGKIYNSTDNRFSVDSIRQISPDKTRSLIVLLRNTNNNGAHYITVKSVGSKTCIVNDPEVNGTVDMSISTIITRAIEFVVISKVASVENRLVESDESKTFTTKFKEWFKNTKVGKSIEFFKNAVSAANTGLNKIKDIVQNPKSLKDAIGGFFSRKDREDNEGKPSKTESILQQILDKLNGIYDKPLPVSIWEDHTLALQSTDERASQALIDAAASSTTSAAELTNAKRIKNLRRKREIQKERSEAQAVQDAIINGENLRAGTSSGIGGRGTGADPNNTQVADQSDKAGLWGTIGGFLRKPLAKIGGKVLPWAAGAMAAAAPTYLAYKLSRPYAEISFNQAKALIEDPTENIVNSEGVVIEGGQYRDPTGLARNVWNMKSLAKGVFALNKKMSTGFGGLATKIASKTVDVTTKLGQWGARGGRVAQKVAKYGGKVAKVAGTAAELFAKGGKFVADIVSSGVVEKLGKLLGKITSLKGWPIVGKAAEYIGSKLGPLVMWLKGKGVKIIQAVTRKAISPQNQAKNIPFVGLGLSVIQGATAIINGYRNADKILRIPKEATTLKYKLMSAAAKFLWDALPMVVSSVISTATGGTGGIAIDACIAIFQMVYGFDNFLIDFFGFDDNWRRSIGAELTKAEDEQEKQGEESLKKELSDSEKSEDADKNKSEKDAKNVKDKIDSQIAKENESKNNMPGVDVTLEADKIAKDQAEMHKRYIFGEKSLAGVIERFGDKGAREQRKLQKKYGEDYDKKRREEIMNSPSVKAAMEAWKANPGSFFHPMGKIDTKITSVFGPRNVKGGSKNHRGVDFSSNGQSGKPVYAYKAGKVITSNKNYGLIEIQHADGTVSRYMHLSDRFPEVGQDVAMGEVIGTSGGIGANGASSYVPHLHFEVRDSAGKNLDPFLQMSLDPKVINVNPGWKNRENIAYFERYPWLKEKDTQADAKIMQAEKAEAHSSVKDKTPSISDKPVGGPDDNSPMYDKSYKSELEKSSIKKQSKSEADKMLIAMNANSKDDLIVQLLQQQVQLMKQNSQLMQSLVNLVGEINSSSKNSNNDMLGALSMSRF